MLVARENGEPLKVLVHVCCAPCYGYAHSLLESEGHEVTGFFFNPNIHPHQEHQRRLHAAQRYAYLKDTRMVVVEEYDIEAWLRGAFTTIDSGRNRCERCYETRLGRTARYAGENGFDAFTSTLLASTHQDHEKIREIAEKSAQESGVQFLYMDFRKGKKEAYEISRELDLYRQGYCGCIFSEEERYAND